MRRFVACMILLITLAMVLGMAVSRFYWGYWLRRPSLVKDLDSLSTLAAASAIKYDENGKPQIVENRQSAFEDEKSFCEGSSDMNECLDGGIILYLEERQLLKSQTSQLSQSTLDQVWDSVKKDLWLPRISNPRYRETGVPVNGLAILFSDGSEDYLLLTRRTSEIANDRYSYLEALIEVSQGTPRIENQVHFFYEIAGIEKLAWKHFALAILVVLSLISLVVVGGARWFRALTRTHK